MTLAADRAECIARSLEFLRAEYNSKAQDDAKARWKLTGIEDQKQGGLESAILQNSDSEFVTVRGKMFMAGIEPKEVLELILNCEGRPAWDDMLQLGRRTRSYGELKTAMLPPCCADVIRLVYKGIPPVSARDLCLLRAWGEDDDGTCWLVAESSEDDSVPKDPNCVRAELRECGYMMTKVQGGCEVVYISQTNFNGWIPVFMQNVLTSQQPQTLKKMFELMLSRKAGA